ncbi:MAG: hypothetical protein ACE5OZ_01005 [Candidatus Heimdallarchaeota archaeon]
MSQVEPQDFILGVSIIISVIIYASSTWIDRKRQQERFAEQAAINSLSPLLMEVFSLEKACELLVKNPDNFESVKKHFKIEPFRERLSSAFVFLSNPSFEVNALNFLLLLYQVNDTFENMKGEDSEVSQIATIAPEILTVTILLRKTIMEAIGFYSKQIGVRKDIDYQDALVVLQDGIDNALLEIGKAVPSDSYSALVGEKKDFANKISELWLKEE